MGRGSGGRSWCCSAYVEVSLPAGKEAALAALVAHPPAGFVPLRIPGVVTRVRLPGDLAVDDGCVGCDAGASSGEGGSDVRAPPTDASNDAPTGASDAAAV